MLVIDEFDEAEIHFMRVMAGIFEVILGVVIYRERS